MTEEMMVIAATNIGDMTTSQRASVWGYMTTDQRAYFEKLKSLIPEEKHLYSKILEGINSEDRKIDQSNYGPTNDHGKNLCNTPICIGGHTVNVCGKKGYSLLEFLGNDFALTAKIIHQHNFPEIPIPRYDNYPNEWALAYIKDRAKREAGK